MDVPTPRPEALAGINRALVVGLGVSGRAAADALAGAGVAVTVVEAVADHPAAAAARAAGHHVRLGADAVEEVGTADLVVPSPGVPEHAPAVAAAIRRGVPIWSEPELGWRLFPRELVAVTGTNGKTSTTELIAAMVAAGGRTAVTCGNIGTPLTTAAASAPDDALLVAELSSFQLRFAGSLRPRVGVLLNLAPDHLDWHPDVPAYAAAKARIWEAQHAGDWALANAGDPTTTTLRDEHAPGRRADFSATAPVPVGVGRDGAALVASFDPRDVPDAATCPLVGLDELLGGATPAPHQVANLAAAACVALLAGAGVAGVRAAALHHRPGRHRHEVVARRDDGVVFVNDSKATNPHAAAAALGSAPSIVWIAGGLSKGVDLQPLAAELGRVRQAVVIGEAAGELAAVCASAGVPAELADGIEDAVHLAARAARPGDTVLLAPACASFDQFRDYAERGERFSAAARAVVTAPPRGGDRP